MCFHWEISKFPFPWICPVRVLRTLWTSDDDNHGVFNGRFILLALVSSVPGSELLPISFVMFSAPPLFVSLVRICVGWSNFDCGLMILIRWLCSELLHKSALLMVVDYVPISISLLPPLLLSASRQPVLMLLFVLILNYILYVDWDFGHS